MSKYTLPNATTGVDDALIQLSSTVTMFIPMLLAFVYFTIMLGGMSLQRKRVGSDNLPMWSTIAGIGTLTVALPMTIFAGLLNPMYLIIIVVVTMLTGLWFLFSQK